MRLFECCCKWKYIIGSKKVYGPIYPAGIGEFPELLSNTQRMMSREQFEDEYADCAACESGEHSHSAHPHKGRVSRFCYDPHNDQKGKSAHNPAYYPHVHVPKVDSQGRAVSIVFE